MELRRLAPPINIYVSNVSELDNKVKNGDKRKFLGLDLSWTEFFTVEYDIDGEMVIEEEKYRSLFTSAESKRKRYLKILEYNKARKAARIK